MYKLILICLLAVSLNGYAQPGKYAGSKKSLIGKEHIWLDSLPQLKGWQMMEGTVMNENAMTDPELHMVNVFKKGTTCLIIFSVREDTASDKAVIADIVEVIGVQKGWSIRTWSCRQNKKPNSYLVAWAKETEGQYMKPIKKAWRFNPDKRRVEVVPIIGIDCENELGCRFSLPFRKRSLPLCGLCLPEIFMQTGKYSNFTLQLKTYYNERNP